jgi:Glutamine cyclotransferase
LITREGDKPLSLFLGAYRSSGSSYTAAPASMARQRHQRSQTRISQNRKKPGQTSSACRSQCSTLQFAVFLCLCGLAAAYTFNVPLAAALVSADTERQLDELVELQGTVSLKAVPKRKPKRTAAPQKPAAKYKVLQVFDHDVNAFTQGLAWYNGSLYESTGMHRQSEVRYTVQ